MVREEIVRGRCIEMLRARRNDERSVGHYFDSGNAFLRCVHVTFCFLPAPARLPACRSNLCPFLANIAGNLLRL
jgi:hypothetical protein